MKVFQSGLFVLLVLVTASCAHQQQKIMFSGEAQGTYYAVTYFDEKGRNFQPEVDSILKAFDLSVSMWVPGSIISAVNRGDSSARPDEWFIDILNRAETIAATTEGAFDFTVGPLVNAWGFGFKNKIRLDSAKVDSLKQFVDYRKVSVKDGMVRKEDPRMQIDFNAIAQGYSVDVVGAFLATQGIENYLVDIGGEVLGKGRKTNDEPWYVGIENPAGDSLSERTIHTKVKLLNKALATSGNYRKYYEEDGIRYSHTIDPKTGYPVRHNLLSVSVLANDCATADGYATAFMVMGLEKSMVFLETEPGLEAFFIADGGSGLYLTHATKGFMDIVADR